MKRIVTPDEVALEDPKDQPPDYGPPMDDDMAYEPIPVSGEQQYFDPDDEDMYPPGDGPGGNPDDHQGGQPPGPPPTGSVAGPNQFGNPDVPLEQLGYPSSDPEEAMPEITSEFRPPDDPGQPPIGFPSDIRIPFIRSYRRQIRIRGSQNHMFRRIVNVTVSTCGSFLWTQLMLCQRRR